MDGSIYISEVVMNCIYCNNEMEKGRFIASATGTMPFAFLEWYSEKEFEKNGFFAALKRKGITIEDGKGGYYSNSHYCQKCKKVFAEFPTK